MGQLFIYIGFFIGVAIISIRILAAVGGWVFSGEKKDSFSQVNNDTMPPFTEEPRDFELQNTNTFNVINLIFKKIPSLIMVWSLGIVFTMLFGAYLSTANIDRLAASGAALESGNTGLALSYLWPMGKDIAKDQYRVTSGNSPVLKKNGLENFKYLGSDKEFHYAMMQNLVTVNDIDPSITSEDDDYDKKIIGAKANAAQDICEDMSEDITTYLIAKSNWVFSYNHILAKMNINREKDIAEWFSNEDSEDNDNYQINFKNNAGLKRLIIDKDEFHASDDGIHFDEEDIHDYLKVGFRCGAKWPKSEDAK